jgi:hypothetical protein
MLTKPAATDGCTPVASGRLLTHDQIYKPGKTSDFVGLINVLNSLAVG